MASKRPSEELLMAYAAGSLPEPVALVIATHLAICPDSRRAVAEYEAIGGALLEEIEPVPLGGDALAKTLARLEEETPHGLAGRAQAGRGAADELPAPLRDYVGDDLGKLPWRRVMRGLEEAELEIGTPGYHSRLLRIQPGVGVPQHTHEGGELTLVLRGAFRDASGRYGVGDLQIADASVDHQPVAETGETCLCLAVTDAPLRLTGPIGRWLNPFIHLT